MHYIRLDAENAATLWYVRWSYSNILFSSFKLSYADVCFLHRAAVSHDQPPWQKSLSHWGHKLPFFFSLSVFSGSIDTAGGVTHCGLWAFFPPQLFLNEFLAVICFSLHRGRVSLASVLQLIIWSMVINLMCDWVCLYLPRFSGWNCAPDLSENTISKLLCPEFADNEEGPSTIAGLSFS